MKLTNASKTPLGIPGNPVLMPGTSMNCKNWEQVKSNRIVKAWQRNGMLVAGEVQRSSTEDSEGSEGSSENSELNSSGSDGSSDGSSTEDSGSSEGSSVEGSEDDEEDDEDEMTEEEEAQALVEALESYGITKTTRTSLVKLRELYEEASAAEE